MHPVPGRVGGANGSACNIVQIVNWRPLDRRHSEQVASMAEAGDHLLGLAAPRSRRLLETTDERRHEGPLLLPRNGKTVGECQSHIRDRSAANGREAA